MSTCPFCGSADAYVGMNAIECSNTICGHFVATKVTDIDALSHSLPSGSASELVHHRPDEIIDDGKGTLWVADVRTLGLRQRKISTAGCEPVFPFTIGATDPAADTVVSHVADDRSGPTCVVGIHFSDSQFDNIRAIARTCVERTIEKEKRMPSTAEIDIALATFPIQAKCHLCHWIFQTRASSDDLLIPGVNATGEPWVKDPA